MLKWQKTLIQSGIDDQTFGPTNAREYFPEEEFTVGRNKLLEGDRLVE